MPKKSPRPVAVPLAALKHGRHEDAVVWFRLWLLPYIDDPFEVVTSWCFFGDKLGNLYWRDCSPAPRDYFASLPWWRYYIESEAPEVVRRSFGGWFHQRTIITRDFPKAVRDDLEALSWLIFTKLPDNYDGTKSEKVAAGLLTRADKLGFRSLSGYLGTAAEARP